MEHVNKNVEWSSCYHSSLFFHNNLEYIYIVIYHVALDLKHFNTGATVLWLCRKKMEHKNYIETHRKMVKWFTVGDLSPWRQYIKIKNIGLFNVSLCFALCRSHKNIAVVSSCQGETLLLLVAHFKLGERERERAENHRGSQRVITHAVINYVNK